MTTIACTPRHMASDSLLLDDTIAHTRKMWRCNGGILGAAGSGGVGYRLAMYLNGTGKAPQMDEEAALWIDGKAIWLFDESVHPYPISDPFAALGTGTMAALAAMHLGQTPRQAVKVASKVDPNTGGKINWMTQKGNPR